MAKSTFSWKWGGSVLGLPIGLTQNPHGPLGPEAQRTWREGSCSGLQMWFLHLVPWSVWRYAVQRHAKKMWTCVWRVCKRAYCLSKLSMHCNLSAVLSSLRCSLEGAIWYKPTGIFFVIDVWYMQENQGEKGDILFSDQKEFIRLQNTRKTSSENCGRLTATRQHLLHNLYGSWRRGNEKWDRPPSFCHIALLASWRLQKVDHTDL